MDYNLSNSLSVKTVSETDTQGVFEIDGLYRGYGITVGNALRRVLLSSIPGAAVTHVKVRNVSHEFSTLPGVMEDIVELGLHIKKLRFRMHTDEPQVLLVTAKGETVVTAANIEPNAQVEIITPELHIATLTSKTAELQLELTVERGLGYSPIEMRKTEKLAIGMIALDAFFSPVVTVNFTVQNMRVGDRADYNRIVLSIDTDGSITPSEALKASGVGLRNHFEAIAGITPKPSEVKVAKKEAAPKKVKKAAAKKK